MYSVNKAPERQRTYRVLHENPVEDYLKEHPNLVISSKRLSKILNLNNKQTILYATNSENVIRAQPSSVGSGKYHLDIYQYNSNQ